MSVGQVFPDQYHSLLQDKIALVNSQFAEDGLVLPTPTVYESEVSHYRMRAECRVWHEADDSFYIMFNPETKERIRVMSPYVVTGKLFAAAKKDALFMHCLPAYRGHEVSESVLEGPQSVIFDEAENRLHAQKGVLAWCFGVD